MNVRFSPAHRKWLSDQVSTGAFASIDEAVAWAIDGMMHVAGDDLEWARPYIEKGDASLAHGEGIPGDEFLARLDRRLDTLR
jgi:Arc/MetJ-type ribon-helix-helix transcriptional regulator